LKVFRKILETTTTDFTLVLKAFHTKTLLFLFFFFIKGKNNKSVDLLQKASENVFLSS